MKRFQHASALFSLLIAVCLASVCFTAQISATESDGACPVSPALNVLAERSGMAKWTLVGNDIYFCEEDFCRALNLSALGHITVTRLPSPSVGTLLVGSTPVREGDVISAASLALLKYQPEDTVSASADSFEFTPEDRGYTAHCGLFVTEKENLAPSVAAVGRAELTRGTYEGITVFGKMTAHDPEGDGIRYEIISYPKNGYLTVCADGSGEYTYTPTEDFSGTDSFKYVAVDKYGDYSVPALVEIEVDRRRTTVVFDDLCGSKYESAAVSLTEEGIMSGTQIGGGYYFYPEREVSRIEFLVMAMNSAGITDVAQVKDTGFSDDAEIPSAMKGYAAAAYRLGYIHGELKDGELCMSPHDSITRAEAAYILSKITGLKCDDATVTVFADSLPAWAEDAIYTMHYYGILKDTNGSISSYSSLTRGDAAQMLDAVIRLAK